MEVFEATENLRWFLAPIPIPPFLLIVDPDADPDEVDIFGGAGAFLLWTVEFDPVVDWEWVDPVFEIADNDEEDLGRSSIVGEQTMGESEDVGWVAVWDSEISFRDDWRIGSREA